MQDIYANYTKEELIAKVMHYETISENASHTNYTLSREELATRLVIAESRLAEFEEKERREEKKREFERRLVEATEFLKANGYEVINMNEQRRQQIQPESSNSMKWTDEQMIRFAIYCAESNKVRGCMNFEEDFTNWKNG